jgi:hypothetical protein
MFLGILRGLGAVALSIWLLNQPCKWCRITKTRLL